MPERTWEESRVRALEQAAGRIEIMRIRSELPNEAFNDPATWAANVLREFAKESLTPERLEEIRALLREPVMWTDAEVYIEQLLDELNDGHRPHPYKSIPLNLDSDYVLEIIDPYTRMRIWIPYDPQSEVDAAEDVAKRLRT